MINFAMKNSDKIGKSNIVVYSNGSQFSNVCLTPDIRTLSQTNDANGKEIHNAYY